MKREKSIVIPVLVCLMLFVRTASGFAQGNSVSLKCDDMPLPAALSQVERQSGHYKINYNYGELTRHKVTADVREKTAPEAVRLLIAGLPLTSTVSGKYIQVKSVAGKAADDVPAVRGRLLDKNGEPLVGAAVKVAGTQQGTVTDADGCYVLEGVEPGETLEY